MCVFLEYKNWKHQKLLHFVFLELFMNSIHLFPCCFSIANLNTREISIEICCMQLDALLIMQLECTLLGDGDKSLTDKAFGFDFKRFSTFCTDSINWILILSKGILWNKFHKMPQNFTKFNLLKQFVNYYNEIQFR